MKTSAILLLIGCVATLVLSILLLRPPLPPVLAAAAPPTRTGISSVQVAQTVTRTNSLNRPPTTRWLSLTTELTRTLVVPMAEIANDADGDTIVFTQLAIQQGSGEVAVRLADQALVYTPAPDMTGTTRIAFEVIDGQGGASTGLMDITVRAVQVPNRPPIAHDDPDEVAPLYRVDLRTPAAVQLDLIVNDRDPDGDLLTLQLPAATSFLGATLRPSTDGRGVVYVPPARTPGAAAREDADFFSYTICDPAGACDTARVVVVVAVPPAATRAVRPPVLPARPPVEQPPTPTAVPPTICSPWNWWLCR